MIRLRDMIQREYLLDHILNLLLIRGARTHNGELDLLRRELTNLQAALCACDQRRATRLTGRKGSRYVLPEPHRFNTDANRLKPLDYCTYLLVDLKQTLTQGLLCGGFDAPIRNAA